MAKAAEVCVKIIRQSNFTKQGGRTEEKKVLQERQKITRYWVGFLGGFPTALDERRKYALKINSFLSLVAKHFI